MSAVNNKIVKWIPLNQATKKTLFLHKKKLRYFPVFKWNNKKKITKEFLKTKVKVVHGKICHRACKPKFGLGCESSLSSRPNLRKGSCSLLSNIPRIHAGKCSLPDILSMGHTVIDVPYIGLLWPTFTHSRHKILSLRGLLFRYGNRWRGKLLRWRRKSYSSWKSSWAPK